MVAPLVELSLAPIELGLMLRLLSVLAALVAFTSASIGRAQSDPANFDTVINLPGDTLPLEIGSSTQLNVNVGGTLPAEFLAGLEDGTNTNTEVNILGGDVGPYFISINSVVNITGGTLSDFFAGGTSVYNMSGGNITGDLAGLYDDTQFNLSGGTIDLSLELYEGTQMNMTGGTLLGGDTGVVVETGSAFHMSGGVLGPGVRVGNGAEFELTGGVVGGKFTANNSAIIRITGNEFRRNGTPYSGSSISLSSAETLTGTLADGTPFIFSMPAGDALSTVQLVQVTVPGAGPATQVINAANPVGPAGLRVGQTLTLQDGGNLGGLFSAVEGTLNIEGGTVGHGLEVYRGVVNISGGTIGVGPAVDPLFRVLPSSEVTMSAGHIASDVQVFGLGQFDVSGGSISGQVVISDRSSAELTGGSFQEVVFQPQSTGLITGGTFERITAVQSMFLSIRGGNPGRTFVGVGAGTRLVGGEFKRNGVNHTTPAISLDTEDVFTGTLADGTVVIFSPENGDDLSSVSLTSATLPPINLTPMVVDSPTSEVPKGLRTNQSLTLRDGGTLPRHFAAVSATLDIEGGEALAGLEVAASTVNVSGGTVTAFAAHQQSQVRISGGVFKSPDDYNASAYLANKSNTVVTGGLFEDTFETVGGTVEIQGGTFDGILDLSYGTVARVRGGELSGVTVDHDSELHLYGTEFLIDGAPIAGLALNQRYTVGQRTGSFAATLGDGSTIDWESLRPVGSVNISFDALFTVTPILPGDYNGDAVVNLADYTVWRDHLGSTVSLPGDLTPGSVTAADYEVWKTHFGQVFPPAALANTNQVPEPSTWMLLLAAIALAYLPRSHAPRGNACPAAPRP